MQTELAIEGLKPKRKAITLFDYQQETLEQFQQWYKDVAATESLIALATGLGKTITACSCVHHVISIGGRVLWITHRDELVLQSAKSLEDYTGEVVGIEKAEQHASYDAKIVVASVQSLKGRRLSNFSNYFTPTLIVFDEAHHSVARTWLAIKMMWPEAKVLNLTATPYRQDIGQRLNLGKVLIEKNTADGIKMGRLVPPKPVGSLGISLDGVRISMGDYETTSLVPILMQPAILEKSVDLIDKHAHGHKGIIFAANVEHGKALAAALTEKGFRCAQIYADTLRETRQAAYQAIKDGELDLLVNNMVLTEGFDLPQIDLVAILRPTRNAALYLQMLGRGLRTAPQKNQCLVIDAIDIQKHSAGTSELILPDESHRKKASALAGRQLTLQEVFLSWFFRVEQVREHIENPDALIDFKHITNGLDLFTAICPTADTQNLRQAQLDMITTMTNFLVDSQDAKPLRVFHDFATIAHCGHIEGMVSILAHNGWQYYPNGTLPGTEEEDEEIAERNEDAFSKKEENFTLNCLAQIEPSLQNFILDVIQSGNLKEQAQKYFVRHTCFGIEASWTIPLETSNNFTFIHVQNNAKAVKEFFVRVNSTGKIYNLHLIGSKIIRQTPITTATYMLSKLPPYSRSSAWTKAPATGKQIPHVAKILKISQPEVIKLNLCAMAAACLMDNHFSKKSIAAIGTFVDNLPVKCEEEIPA